MRCSSPLSLVSVTHVILDRIFHSSITILVVDIFYARVLLHLFEHVDFFPNHLWHAKGNGIRPFLRLELDSDLFVKVDCR
jgi:hypothetical protein